MLSKYSLKTKEECVFVESGGSYVPQCTENNFSKTIQQSQNYNSGLGFSTTNYWSSTTSSYPAYVYNENSNLYLYVSEYENYLKKDLKVVSARAELMSYEQATELGCENWNCSNSSNYGGPSSRPVPEWVYLETYWLGFADNSTSVRFIATDGAFISNSYASVYSEFNGTFVGVRPVITISAYEIE